MLGPGMLRPVTFALLVFEREVFQIISLKVDCICIAENQLTVSRLRDLLRNRAALAGDIAHYARLHQ